MTITELLVEKELGTEMINEFAAEVFRTLCMLTRNEANLVVRGSRAKDNNRMPDLPSVAGLKSRKNP